MANCNYIFKEVACKKCGATFIPTFEWAYKEAKKGRNAFYCSWKCFNHRHDEKGRRMTGGKEKRSAKVS